LISEQAEQFYRELKQQDLCVRVGLESSGHSRWFERLLHELGVELWIGDPAEMTLLTLQNKMV
jgi:transposase